MKKIFVLGTNQLNFVYLLCKGVKKIDPGFVFSGFELMSLSGKPPADLNEVFTKYYPNKINAPFFLLAAVRSLGQGMFWRSLLFILFVEFKLRKAIHFGYQWNREQSFFLAENLSEYHIFHFHFAQYSYLRSIWFIPRKSRVICSFWGSDLLRTTDPFNHFFVQRALERADIITTQSLELRQIIVSKFGLHLQPRIRIRKFALDRRVFELIDQFEKGDKALLRSEMGIPSGKIVIMVGHNASHYNNHEAIIKSLLELNNPGDVYLVIPFMYGMAPREMASYRKKLAEALKGNTLEHKFITEYLGENDVAKLRVVTDIMIHMPITDALSGSATECMYAGNLLITGSWLPYSPFREAGLYYAEIGSMDALTAKVEETLKNVADLRERCKANRKAVHDHFFPEVTSRAWVDLFDELAEK